MRASQIASFLTQALGGGEETVVALQEKARAAGLLSERQSITNSKPFKLAKASLGIRSRRIGFGPGAVWFWVLPATPAPEVTTTAGSPDAYDVDISSPCYAESAGGRPHDAPVEWIRGVNVLQQGPRPLGIPPHRRRLSWRTPSNSLSAHGQGVRLNSAGLPTNCSAAVIRVPTSTWEPRVCSGIWVAVSLFSCIAAGRRSSLRTEGCEPSIDDPTGQ